MVMPQTTDWPRLLTDGRLWSARYQQETLELTVFDPETGNNLEFAPKKPAQPAAEPPAAPVQPEEAPAGTEPEA